MIFTRLTTTHTEANGGRFITIPEVIQTVFPIKEGRKFLSYANATDSELYVSLQQLDIPLGAAMVFGPNKEGVMAAIAGAFGDRDLNITALSSFGIGKASMTELIAQEHKSVSSDRKQERPSEPKEKEDEHKVPGFIGKFEEAVKDLHDKGFTVHAQELARVFSGITLLPKETPITVEKHTGTELIDLKIDDLVMDQLNLQTDKEYDVLMTYYMRFPILVIKFVTQPDSFIQVTARIHDNPNVLGRICAHLKTTVNFYFGTVYFNDAVVASAMRHKATVELYGNLLVGGTKRNVENALLSVNQVSREDLIDPDSITVRLVSEIGRG